MCIIHIWNKWKIIEEKTYNKTLFDKNHKMYFVQILKIVQIKTCKNCGKIKTNVQEFEY